MSDLVKAGENRRRGRWKPGESGNPRGRPRGFRSMIAAEFDGAAMKDAPAVYAAIRQAATGGDMRASELLMQRWWPPLRRTALDIPDMPKIETAGDIMGAFSHVMGLAARNEISAEQAEIALRMLEMGRKVIETNDLAARIAELERRNEGA